MLGYFHIFAFTHQQLDLEILGQFHINDDELKNALSKIKSLLGLEELMLLSTCNRFELMMVGKTPIDGKSLHKIFSEIKPEINEEDLSSAVSSASHYRGLKAVEHLFKVASSTESLVVGEREIITQVRHAYEECNTLGFTGDFIRLTMKITIETAKKVYTETGISARPVSVVSLAYRKFRELNHSTNDRVLFVGAGQTNVNIARFFKKFGFTNFTFFNRSLENAEKMVEKFGGKAHKISKLNEFRDGFDVIVACTGASESTIDEKLYAQLLQGDQGKKTIIDLGIPNDVDRAIHENYPSTEINVNALKEIAAHNLKQRKQELFKCHEIIDQAMRDFTSLYRERNVELAMQEVPREIKQIKQRAMNDVFNKEMEELDENSKEVLEKIMSYIEKKYISVPMKMAKKIMLENPSKS